MRVLPVHVLGQGGSHREDETMSLVVVILKGDAEAELQEKSRRTANDLGRVSGFQGCPISAAPFICRSGDGFPHWTSANLMTSALPWPLANRPQASISSRRRWKKSVRL